MAVIITHGITEELIVIAEMNFFFCIFFLTFYQHKLVRKAGTTHNLLTVHKIQ